MSHLMARVRVLYALLLVAALPIAAQAQTLGETNRYFVLPFDNPNHDARLYWLTEASAILLADGLNLPGSRAYSRDERLEAFERLQVPPAASLSHATVIRLGQLVGATHVVIGSLTLDASQISAKAQTIRLDTGRLEREVVESGSVDNLFGIFDRLTSRLAPSPPGANTPVLHKPPLPAFENYVKGLLAATVPTKVSYLQAALKLDPAFDRARLALWSVQQDNGNFQAALAVATLVQESSPFYARARFASALSLMQLKRLDEAFAVLKALADRSPSATALNNLGVVQLRRPVTPQTGKATYYFNQALTVDATDPDYYFNAGYAYWLERDNQGAIYWLREAVRRRPEDGEAHALLSAALQSVGSTGEATRERELAAQLSAKPVDASTRGLERVKPALETSAMQRVDSAIAESGQRDQRDMAAFHLERAGRLFDQGNDQEASAELKRTLFLSPYEAEAHLLLGRIYLRTGRTQDAIDAFKIALWSSESAAAHLALARAYAQARNNSDARVEAQRALTLSPNLSEARTFLDQLAP